MYHVTGVSKMNTTTSFAHQVRVKASRADTEQTHITAAHNEAFDSAHQFVQFKQYLLIPKHA